ncbi:MAG TPA: SurA N-terminal domain-containing protein [Candidatus Saccharimonadales bacterium]|nr:SurA N-terminal domain-containing protein [Candidatus Saccharimonadales bacterium]
MIGTIRKHSSWLWGIIIAATVVSFVWWGASIPSRGGGGGGAGNLGAIAGQRVTQDAYLGAEHEVYIYFWLRYHQWPDTDSNISPDELQREIYVRLMLIQEGQKLGIYIGDDAVATAAKDILSSPGLLQSLGVDRQSVPLDDFVRAILQPKGLTAADFENFVRHDLLIDQVRQVMGLSGELITPQEAADVYERQNQKSSVQIVFFSASNYLASVPVTAAAVDEFYTNYLAEYRLPDRVQVSYVAFTVTNLMPEAEQKLSKTNLADQVEAIYRQYGTNAFPDAKTPEETEAKIRDLLIRQQALVDARQQANDFATEVFNMNPVRPENLATVAKQKGLVVHVTAPFGSEYGPEEFTAPAAFTKAAFALTPDEPLGGPIVGRDAVYVIALDQQLPSEIPSLSQIHARVTRDYQLHEATLRAQQAGTNFVQTLQSGMAGGKSFSSLCLASGLHPETLPPFSLSTADLPELGDRATLEQLKSATLATSVGHASGFEPTDNGGFIVYVKSQLPIDVATMEADLPQFTAQLRQQRANEAFYIWLERTGSQELRNTPVFPGASGDNAQ